MKKFARVLALVLVVAMACLALASCGAPNADPTKAKEALKENGYDVAKVDADGNILELGIIAAMRLAGVDDIESVVTGKKDGESVVIVYFESVDAAKAELEDVQDYAGDFECVREGKMIYYGTKEGIKAAQ